MASKTGSYPPTKRWPIGDSTVTIVSSEPPLTPSFGLKNTGKAQYKIEG